MTFLRPYLELLNQLTTFAGQLQEITAESKKMGASLVHGWFLARLQRWASFQIEYQIGLKIPRFMIYLA